jgi:hypothetical protein
VVLSLTKHLYNKYKLIHTIIRVCENSNCLVIILIGPQSRTLQPVRGEGYEPAYKSRANAETHPRLGREVVVFREGGEKLYTGRVSPSTSDLPPAPQPLNQSHLYSTVQYRKTPLPTFRNELAR